MSDRLDAGESRPTRGEVFLEYAKSICPVCKTVIDAAHKQHPSLGLIEVNSGCNLDCPICFADFGQQPDGFSLSREHVAVMLDAFVAAEGESEVVQFSGVSRPSTGRSWSSCRWRATAGSAW